MRPEVKAIALAQTRSGGIWLNHCLSNHPQVFWARGEPLLPRTEYKLAFPQGRDAQILQAIHGASFYHVAGCKVTWEQWNGRIKEYCQKRGVRVILVWRENLLRCTVSQIICGLTAGQRIPGYKAHTTEPLKPIRVKLPPGKVVSHMEDQGARAASVEASLRGLPVLKVSYAELVGGEGQEAVGFMPEATSYKLCRFLDVKEMVLFGSLRKVNRWPLEEMIENWDQVREAVAKSKLRQFLE